MQISITNRKALYATAGVMALQVGTMAFQMFGPAVTDVRRAAREIVSSIPPDRLKEIDVGRQPTFLFGQWEVPINFGNPDWPFLKRYEIETYVMRFMVSRGVLSTPRTHAQRVAQHISWHMNGEQIRQLAGHVGFLSDFGHRSNLQFILQGRYAGLAYAQIRIAKEIEERNIHCGVSDGNRILTDDMPDASRDALEKALGHAAQLRKFAEAKGPDAEALCFSPLPSKDGTVAGTYLASYGFSVMYPAKSAHSAAMIANHERAHHRLNQNINTRTYHIASPYRSDSATMHLLDEANAFTMDLEAAAVARAQGSPKFWDEVKGREGEAVFNILEKIYGAENLKAYMQKHNGLPPLIRRQVYAQYVLQLPLGRHYRDRMSKGGQAMNKPVGTSFDDALIRKALAHGTSAPYDGFDGIAAFIRHNTAAQPDAHNMTPEALLARLDARYKRNVTISAMLSPFQLLTEPNDVNGNAVRCGFAAFSTLLSNTPQGFGEAPFMLADMRQLSDIVRERIEGEPRLTEGQRRFRLGILDDFNTFLAAKMGTPAAPGFFRGNQYGRIACPAGGGGN